MKQKDIDEVIAIINKQTKEEYIQHRIKDAECILEMEEKYNTKKYLSQYKTKDEVFEAIWAIGCDYDGYRTPIYLMSLIDELIELANYGRRLEK